MQVLHHGVPESPVEHLIDCTIEVQFNRLLSFLHCFQVGHLLAAEPNEQGEGKRAPGLCTSIRAILVGKPAHSSAQCHGTKSLPLHKPTLYRLL